MRAKYPAFIVIAALACANSAGAFAAETARKSLENVDEVLSCMRANMAPAIWSSRIEMTAVDAGGFERQLQGQFYADISDQSSSVSIRLNAPADMAGAAYLMKRRKSGDKDVHVYLPSLGRAKRLSLNVLDGSIFGTDISFNEIALLVGAFDLAWLDLPGKLEGRSIYRVNVWPQAGLSPRYKQIRLQVDQQSCVALRFDLMDAKGSAKLMLVDGKQLKQIGAQWLPTNIEIQDLENGTQTRLKFLDTKKLERVPSQVLEPSGFWK